MAIYAEAVSQAERMEAHNARFKASIASKDAELKHRAEELEDLKASKIVALDRVNDLEGKVESITIEAAQAEVMTKTFTLEQVIRGSLALDSAKKELEAMAALQGDS